MVVDYIQFVGSREGVGVRSRPQSQRKIHEVFIMLIVN